MTPQNKASIGLPTARHIQLKALAKKRGVTLSELIEGVIVRAIREKEIPDSTPGFEIVIKDRHVWFCLGAFGLPPLGMEDALRLSFAIDKLARPGDYTGAIKIELPAGFSFSIARKGSGVIFLAEEETFGTRAKASMTPMMAEDISRQLQNAATSFK